MKKELKLKNQVGELERVNRFIEEIGNELGLSMELRMDLNLVIEEMVSNVIFYAYPKDVEGEIELEAEYDGNELCFVLSDSGKEFDPTQKEDANPDINPTEGNWWHGHLYRQEHHERGELSATGGQESADDEKEHQINENAN